MPIKGGALLARTPIAAVAKPSVVAKDRSRSAGTSARKGLKYDTEAPVAAANSMVAKSLAFPEPVAFDTWAQARRTLAL